MLISRDLETLIDACLCLRSVLDMSKLTLYYDLYEVFSFLTWELTAVLPGLAQGQILRTQK